MRSSNFWEDKERAQKFAEELSHLKEEIENFENIDKELKDLDEFVALADTDEEIARELSRRLDKLEKNIAREEIKTFLSGPYDANGAIITIYSGAGGVDAQDWARILTRMYERYTNIKGYKVTIISQSFGEEGGVKEVTIGVEGKYAYGYLKNENGVHRLVRISPYSSQKLRHTSFALVEVLPELKKGSPQELEIKPDEIEVQTFRSSGPGGQHVNKTESAVRVKHLPSGIVVECQSGRLQGENKEKALKLLASRLFAKRAKEEKEKIEEIRGGFISAEWGNQIRSYVLHPYKMVKDHRTGVETSDVDAVLDGDLEEFIEAGVKLKAKA